MARKSGYPTDTDPHPALVSFARPATHCTQSLHGLGRKELRSQQQVGHAIKQLHDRQLLLQRCRQRGW
eukprot:4017630-Prorocentrum_lima.AAC.1